jgi:glycosyltransferase involved in cell wall biosynthesis
MTHYFSQTGNGAPDLIHCWTPRSVVRSLAQPIIEKFECPYIIHFEDNEVAVADAHGNADNAGRLANGTSKTADLVQSMPQFITGAAGATVIVDALRELLPEELPCHLLEPGVDTSLFLPGLEAGERSRLCDALSVPADARIIVYPGNIHSANADDMFSLYVAVHALNKLGFKTHLIRTGTDHLPVIDPVFAVLTKRYVTNLGFIRREWLIEILKLADLFIQPGGPDDFNKYRLPSKIPEFLAMACPLILPNTNIGLKLEHGINALLMERGDAAEITECVKAILIDPALGTRIGQQGRRFAIDHFNWERSAKQLEGFYQKVLQRGHTRGAR